VLDAVCGPTTAIDCRPIRVSTVSLASLSIAGPRLFCKRHVAEH